MNKQTYKIAGVTENDYKQWCKENKKQARVKAGEYAYQFYEATNVRYYEIGVASKDTRTEGGLKSPWMGIIYVYI